MCFIVNYRLVGTVKVCGNRLFGYISSSFKRFLRFNVWLSIAIFVLIRLSVFRNFTLCENMVLFII